jgi:hypothetical protein
MSTLETAFTEEGLTIRFVDDVPLNIVDGCWIDYRFRHIYTGNFVSDTISIGTEARDGTLTANRNVSIGSASVPNDVVHNMGSNIDGGFYLSGENQGLKEIDLHRVIEDESFQLELLNGGAPLPSGTTGDAWIGANGLTAALLSLRGGAVLSL